MAKTLGSIRVSGSMYRSAFTVMWLMFACLAATSATHLLRNGRHYNGFVGLPSHLPSTKKELEVEDKWFIQRLNHMDDDNTTTWKQRYYINAEHYRNDSSAPIFLLLGGEAAATKRWMHEGAWIHYAEHFGALCFQLEHRYYGASHPTSDLSTENLRYLTSQQALADIAAFIVAMRRSYKLTDDQKWIVFGGSYPGSLAAWSRQLYPQLIHGAISSSGPLLAKVDFFEYYQVVRESLATHSDDCVVAVEKAFEQIEILLRHPIGQKTVDTHFKTCTDMKDSVGNRLDVANFYETLASNIADIVQYSKDNSPHATIDIDEACNIMTNDSVVAYARLATINNIMLRQSKESCTDYKYADLITAMMATAWTAKVATGQRQWTYQTCNEFGFYQTSEKADATFGDRFNVDFFVKQCMDIYSGSLDIERLTTAVEQTNRIYGGLHPNTTNVLYVHGSIDPWHALGLIASNDPKLPTIFINGTAHCADMYEPLKSDPAPLVAARNQIVNYLAKLLSSNFLDDENIKRHRI